MASVILSVSVFFCLLVTVASLKNGRVSTHPDRGIKVKRIAQASAPDLLLGPAGGYADQWAKQASGLAGNATQAITQLSMQPAQHAAYKKGKLVMFFGASLDADAVRTACAVNVAGVSEFAEDAGFPIPPDAGAFARLRSCYCTFDGMTVVFSFHPGATPPPYYEHFGKIQTTTTEIFNYRIQQLQKTFGKTPDAIIVDSSVWDAAAWWQQGSQGQPIALPVPHVEIKNWCDVTVPHFLSFLTHSVRQSHVAFRSPPPAFPSTWHPSMERLDEITEDMYSCLLTKSDKNTFENYGSQILYGRYPMVDYHAIVQAKQKELGLPMRQLYQDDIHPGSDLAMAYMGAALKWVKGLPSPHEPAIPPR